MRFVDTCNHIIADLGIINGKSHQKHNSEAEK